VTIHILNDPGHYVVVRCHASESGVVLSTLTDNGFSHGKVRDVDDIPQLVDINVKRGGSWSQIDGGELRTLFKDKGFEVAG
jgi:hypothetical protein